MAFKSLEFVAACIDDKLDAGDWVGFGDIGPMFLTELEKSVHAFVNDYVRQNGKLPTRQLLQSKFEDPFVANASSTFIFDRMKERYLEHSIREGVQSIAPMLQNGEGYQPAEALVKLRDTLVMADLSTKKHSIVDVRDAMFPVFEEYKKKAKGAHYGKGLMLGWPTIDLETGGLDGGELASIVGRPATGKTWFMLQMAGSAWGFRRVLFVTLEMPAKQIVARMISMMAGVPYKMIHTNQPLADGQLAQIDAALKYNSTADPFYILDGKMASSVLDIEMVARSVQAEAIYIDGAYLLKHPDQKLNRYQRVAENVDLLKDAALRIDKPIICSWQFNREAAKKFNKKEVEEPDLEDIGYSDAIPQHSSLVLGLMAPNDTDKRAITVLKGRGGEVGKFVVNWDFAHMKFDEDLNYAESGLKPVL